MASFKDRLAGARDWALPVLKGRLLWIGLALMVLGLGVLYVTVNSVLMPLYTRQGSAVIVPEMREMTYDEALSLLRSRNLRAERREQPFNPSLPLGSVVDQNPLPNASVKPGRRVYLYVNSGTERTASMPEVRTLAESLARAQLTQAGFAEIEVRTDDRPSPFAGTVTRQEPEAGATLRTGDPIVLWISPGLGTELAEVPDVTGLAGSDAERALASAGLWTDPTQRLSDLVTRQDPAPGERVRVGTEIRLSSAPIESPEVPESDDFDMEEEAFEAPPEALPPSPEPPPAPQDDDSRDADRTDW